MRTACSAVPQRTSTVATMRSRNDLRSERCSACARSTTRSRQLGKRPVRKLDPPVRAALRLGAYQLGYTEVAQHAAVNETVELVRRAGLERAVPFTNAVMRRLSEGIRGLLDALPEDTAEAAALKHSYPGLDRGALVGGARPGAGARAHARAERAGGAGRPIEPPQARARRGPARPGSSRRVARRADRRGGASRRADRPQSRGSQLAGLVVGAQPGERTLDLCAAPGGKATQLQGDVVAVELHPGRARELQENCRLLGADNVTVVNADATELPPELTGFDRVLVDAPCSGLGVLAARPDLRWRARPLPELQQELLRVAAERVKPGGTIVYSVCTMDPEENEAVVDASGLQIEPLGDEWPQFRHPKRPEFLLTLPHVHGTAGFFIARLRT